MQGKEFIKKVIIIHSAQEYLIFFNSMQLLFFIFNASELLQTTGGYENYNASTAT